MSYSVINGWSVIPLPSSPTPRQLDFSINDTVGETFSPFTRQTQIQQWPGADWWELNVSLPSMSLANARNWIAWLMSMRGKANVTQIGNPLGRYAQGSMGRNILLYSQDYTQSAWLKQNGATAVADGTTAPDLTSTAILVSTTNSGNASQGIHQAITADGVSNYVLSIYVRPGLSSRATVTIYDLTANTDIGIGWQVLSGSGSFTGETISGLSAGSWTRVSVRTSTPPPAGHSINAYFYVDNAAQTTSGFSNYAWGAQLEKGISASGYVPTLQPLLNGSGLSGGTILAGTTMLPTKGWFPSVPTGLLQPGDYMQINNRLYCVAWNNASSVASDGSGNATIEIWPSLRDSLGDGTPINLYNTTGIFRLQDNKRDWSVRETKLYGINFRLAEAR